MTKAKGSAPFCARCAAAAVSWVCKNANCAVPVVASLMTPVVSLVFEYSPMIFKNGAFSVKYAPGCVMVVRAKPFAAGSFDGVFVQKLLKKDSSEYLTGSLW